MKNDKINIEVHFKKKIGTKLWKHSSNTGCKLSKTTLKNNFKFLKITHMNFLDYYSKIALIFFNVFYFISFFFKFNDS